MSGIPRAPLFIGLAGLIPFIWSALTYLSGDLNDWGRQALGPRFVGPYVQLFHGSVVLSFMSGVLWGFATKTSGSKAATCYTLSRAPCALGVRQDRRRAGQRGHQPDVWVRRGIGAGRHVLILAADPGLVDAAAPVTVRSCIGQSCLGSKSVSDERTINAYTGRVADYLKVALPLNSLKPDRPLPMRLVPEDTCWISDQVPDQTARF